MDEVKRNKERDLRVKYYADKLKKREYIDKEKLTLSQRKDLDIACRSMKKDNNKNICMFENI